MRVSIRTSFNVAPEVATMSWADLCDLYRGWSGIPMKGTTPTEKPHDLPLIGFCAFDQADLKGPPGCRRGNMNPEGLYCIAYDFDDADPQVFARILEGSKRVSDRGMVHTTWKHGLTVDGTVRARIVLPCDRDDRPVPTANWEPLWWSVAQVIGAALPLETIMPGSGLDTHTSNPERLWYVPCRNLDAPEWAPHLEVWG